MTVNKPYQATGTGAQWYRGRELTAAARDRFRRSSLASGAAKARAMRGECSQPKHAIPSPRLVAEDLMRLMPPNQLQALSLFSGGGGLDIGFDRAGFSHVASFEIREDAAAVLKAAHPEWMIEGGPDGDVCQAKWGKYKGEIDVLHGGPPCQPFSHAGYRSGADDVRDMFPQLIRAVIAIKPRVFVAENVPGLATKRFAKYVEETIFGPLRDKYTIRVFTLAASNFGIPQRRRRVWFVGFRNRKDAANFVAPPPTHFECLGEEGLFGALQQEEALPTKTAREALGLADIGYDSLAPTIRSGFSGPRHTTSVVNSVTSLKQWQMLKIWPHGVAENKEKAAAFVAPNGDFRLSIPDCMLLQGFPESWPFKGPVYRSLGLIGNSVAPPMAYQVAIAVARALGAHQQPTIL
jgi:DNA (cytosine-5)-methyltransferase 1